MACVWCEDEELALKMLQILPNYQRLDTHTVKKAIQDFYFCTDCINTYHRLKNKNITDVKTLEVLADLKIKQVTDYFGKVRNLQEHSADDIFHNGDYDLGELYRPVLEAIQHPYLLMDKSLFEILERVILWMTVNKDKLENYVFDYDQDYPGVLILLVSRKSEVREWASDFLSGISNKMSSENMHKYSAVFNTLLNILTNVDTTISTRIAVLPHCLPSYSYDQDLQTVLSGYSKIFSLVQSRILRMVLSTTSNKTFTLKLVEAMKDGHLFWAGAEVFEILLEKLQSSFWLITTAFRSPIDLFSFLTSHWQFCKSVNSAKEEQYKEKENDDLFYDEVDTLDMKILKIFNNCSNSKLFSWFLPFLKTVVELDGCFDDVITLVFDFVRPIIEHGIKTTELYVSACGCFIQLLQYLIDTGHIACLKPSVSVTEVLIIIVEISSQMTRSYQVLKNICVTMVTSLAARSKGLKHINDKEYLSFQSNWKKLGNNIDYRIEIVKEGLANIFETPVNIKTDPDENPDNKLAIQEQIKFMQRLGSAETPITLDDDDDVDGYGDDKVFDMGDVRKLHPCVINISDSEDDNDVRVKTEPVEYTSANFIGSQSPIQISDDDDDDDDVDDEDYGYNEDFVDAVNELETEFESSSTCESNDTYLEEIHGQVHFSVEDSDSNVAHTTQEKPKEKEKDEEKQDVATSTVPVIAKSKVNFSSLKSKLSGGINKNKLFKNQNKRYFEDDEPTVPPKEGKKRKSDIGGSDTDKEIGVKNPELYQNQLYDIGSTFERKRQEKEHNQKKRTVKNFPQSLRRESLEKDLAKVSTPPKPARRTSDSKFPAAYLPPKLPTIESTRKYTIDLFQDSILAWEPSWLENGRDELEVKAQINSVKENYNSYDDYMKTYWPLMLLETWCQLRRDWEENLLVRKCFFVESHDETSNTRTRLLRCSYVESTTAKDVPSYNEVPVHGDLVFMTYSSELKVFGIVDSMEKTNITDTKTGQPCKMFSLGILVRSISALSAMKTVTVMKLSSLTTVLRQWKAIIGFQSSLLAKDILKPFRAKTYSMKGDLITRSGSTMKLNADQFQAVSTAIRSVNEAFAIPRICLVQGPPGTGKSYTVKQMISNILLELAKHQPTDTKSKKNAVHRNRILVCAPSNAAIDEIAKRLLSSPPKLPASTTAGIASPHQKTGSNCGDFNLLRIGRRPQVDPALHPHCLEYLVEHKMESLKFRNDRRAIQREMRRITQSLESLDHSCVKLKMFSEPEKIIEYESKMKEREKLQQRYDELTKLMEESTNRIDIYQERKLYAQKLLLHADVICCTLSGAGNDWMVKTFKDNEKRIAFKCVIIDEAGQCTEPDALIPLQYGASKLILVGDQCQLPATVFSKKAVRYNFGMSMFERMMRALTKHRQHCSDSSRGERAALMLSTQYRMARKICEFPSKHFYNNRLRPSKSLIKRDDKWPLKQYLVINLKGKEKKVSSGALHNPVERDYVFQLCEIILKETPLKQLTIGVITPYRQQVKSIKQKLIENNMRGITVNTIDGYQGQEKDVIIISCVRGPNQKKTIGFLSHPQRMNVALTRARKTLIILANCDSIEVDEDWKKLFEDADDRNVLCNAEKPDDAVKSLMEDFVMPRVEPVLSSSSVQPTRRTVFIETPLDNTYLPPPARSAAKDS